MLPARDYLALIYQSASVDGAGLAFGAGTDGGALGGSVAACSGTVCAVFARGCGLLVVGLLTYQSASVDAARAVF